MDSGETRWIPLPYGRERKKSPAGWFMALTYDRVERDDGFEGDILPWGSASLSTPLDSEG